MNFYFYFQKGLNLFSKMACGHNDLVIFHVRYYDYESGDALGLPKIAFYYRDREERGLAVFVRDKYARTQNIHNQDVIVKKIFRNGVEVDEVEIPEAPLALAKEDDQIKVHVRVVEQDSQRY